MYTVKQISECIGLDSQGDLDYQINRVTSLLDASQQHLAVAFHPRFFKALVSLNPTPWESNPRHSEICLTVYIT
jgi:UDP-3-O-[3-hydroxymyristoyl] glucosamine N-acyltransferase